MLKSKTNPRYVFYADKKPKKQDSYRDMADYKEIQELRKRGISGKRIIYIPLSEAFEMRRKGSGIGSMQPKRPAEYMDRIRKSMRIVGFIEPIPADYEEIEEGRLQEGKHRLIIAKELGIKLIPIEVSF